MGGVRSGGREASDGSRWAGWWVPVGLFALALAVRALPYRAVLPPGGVFPYGGDAFYHLRRIVYSLVRFPASLDFDRYIAFPEGARPIWTPTFDWLVALLLRPFAGEVVAGDLSDLTSLERAAMWVPPLLGASTVVALHALARRHFDPAVAALAGLILALLSGHFWYSQIGFLDHHAAVALAGVGVLAAGMELMAPRGSGPGMPVAAGLALALALWVWPGSLAHVGLVLVGALAHLLTRSRPEEARAAALRLAGCAAVAAVALAPFAAERWVLWGRLSPVVASAFQPLLFAGVAGFAAVCARLWRRRRLGGSQVRRAASAGLVAAGLVAASLALPELRDGLGEAWRWVAKREAFQLQVSESQPLLVQAGRLDPRVAARRLSLFFFLFPVGVLALGWWVRLERDRARIFLLLGFASGLFALALVQRRFFNSLSVPLALLMAWSACLLYRLRPPAWQGARARLWAGLVALGVGLQLWPSLATYAPDLRNLGTVSRGERVSVSPHRMRQRNTLEMARWLGRHTPATAGWLDADVRPEYGVLAPWHLGHMIEYGARRPTVANQFGDDIGEEPFRRPERYFLGREPEGSALLDRLGVRFVVAARPLSFSGGRRPPRGSVYASLMWYDGSERPTEAAAAKLPTIPALTRHRLRYESPPPALRREGGAALKVFEHVVGARLRGRAAPGARVVASLELVTNRGRVVHWESGGRADEGGAFELRVPYANRGSPPAVRVAPRYRLTCREDATDVVVGEAAVQRGHAIEVGPLCGAPSAAGATPDSPPEALL